MTTLFSPNAFEIEPTTADLAAIDAEMPVIRAGIEVVDAESAVLRAAGLADEFTLARLARARRVELAERVRRQRRRALGHTARAEFRLAQVIPLRRNRGSRTGGEAA